MAFWGVFYTLYSGIRRITGQPPEQETSDKENKRYNTFLSFNDKTTSGLQFFFKAVLSFRYL